MSLREGEVEKICPLGDWLGFSTGIVEANDDLGFSKLSVEDRKTPRANRLVADHLEPAARKAGITGKVDVHTRQPK